MESTTKNPFEVATQARTIRMGRSVTVDYLNSFFKEAGFNFSPCELASVTYLTWHESVTASGLTFPEYLKEMGFPDDCTIDRAIESQFAKYRMEKAEKERVRMQQAEREQQKETILTISLGAAGTAALASVGFFLWRRHRIAVAEMEAEEAARGGPYSDI